jgi:hypothetical protein
MTNILQYARTKKRTLGNTKRDVVVYEALLRAGLFEEVLQGVRSPDPRIIARHARSAAKIMYKMMESGVLKGNKN